GDPVVIDLPKGHYHPVFVRAPEEGGGAASQSAAQTPNPPHANGHAAAIAQADAAPRAEGRRPPARGRTVTYLLAGLVVLLAAAALTLYLSNRKQQQAAATEGADPTLSTDESRAVWSQFADDPQPPLLVLSSPTVIRFINGADPEALSARAIALSPEQTRLLGSAPEFKGQWAGGESPRLIPSLGMYTGMGEAIGLHRLTDLFRTANKNILLKQSRQVSAADLKYRNVILLGSIYVNEWSRRLPSVEKFSYTFNATIENHDPQPGEEREYRPQFDPQTGELVTDYALVTVKPNVSGEHAVMTLAGIFSEGTEAATEFVTARNHLAALGQRLRQLGGAAGPPRYYQALLKVGVENGTPTTIELISLHALPEPSQ
ncbi:MAG TPA: hypothetical protein VNZ44_20765, partial [Pyrinomonadaceae bacterium]|nr:hypothetical protein [Pyrinomonadaceae bacterium]